MFLLEGTVNQYVAIMMDFVDGLCVWDVRICLVPLRITSVVSVVLDHELLT